MSAPPHAKAWDQSAAALRADLEELKGMVENEANDLFAKVGNDEAQTIMRKLLMLADHNAYHVGQLVLLRRLLP